MKIAVVSAHRGDAAFAAGLSVDAWLEAGHAVEVIACFTRSASAPYSDAGSLHANDRMSFVSAVRKREDEAWVKRCPPGPGRGRLTLTELNLKEAPLRLHVGADEVFGLEVDRAGKAAVKLQRAVERSRAQALLLPLALDRHIDRLTARTVALESWPPGLPVAFYEDLPQASMLADGEQAILQTVQGIAEGNRMPLTPQFANAPAPDVDAAAARKRRLAWCYDSQIDEATTSLIAEACRQHAGRERLWGNAAWAASGLAGMDSRLAPGLWPSPLCNDLQVNEVKESDA